MAVSLEAKAVLEGPWAAMACAKVGPGMVVRCQVNKPVPGHCLAALASPAQCRFHFSGFLFYFSGAAVQALAFY